MEEDLLQRLVRERDYVLTQEEASWVWSELNRELSGNRRLRVLSLLNEQLVRELAKGKRCGVCGRYANAACITDC